MPAEFRSLCQLIKIDAFRDSKQAILLAVFLVFAASASGQTGKNFKFHPDGNLQKSDVVDKHHKIIINYSVSELNIENKTNASGSFYRVTIPGHMPSADPGKPEVPVLCRLITIPEGSSLKIKISDVKTSRINPRGKKIEGILYPAQESETKGLQQTKPAFRFDKTAYAVQGLHSLRYGED